MITCKLIGPSSENNGLGNQMFCIAATASLAKDNNDTAVFPQLSQSGSTPYLDSLFSKLDNNDHDYSFAKYLSVELDIHTFNPIQYKDGMYLEGYWQSHKYFGHNRDLILNLFSIPEKHKAYIDSKYEFKKPTVAIHVRRGDYVDIPHAHPLCSLSYYNAAIENFKELDCAYMVFSDDLDWCKLNFPPSYTFVDESDYISLYMMSLCDHNIIANSSFSWWGAWLNTNDHKKVIYPKQWFGEMYPGDISDRIPSNWVGVGN
tara:strand:- start:6276 stop:7055 length:780 start_codon:yes stop_codon:yes gene_type:complete